MESTTSVPFKKILLRPAITQSVGKEHIARTQQKGECHNFHQRKVTQFADEVKGQRG